MTGESAAVVAPVDVLPAAHGTHAPPLARCPSAHAVHAVSTPAVALSPPGRVVPAGHRSHVPVDETWWSAPHAPHLFSQDRAWKK